MERDVETTAIGVGHFMADGRTHSIKRIRFVGPGAGHEPIQIALLSGVHGDELAGPAGLAEFLRSLGREPWRAAGYDLWVYPVVNPTGLEEGIRENWAGKDLNREFWRNSAQPEVKIIEAELEKGQFDGLITLHADDTCEGHYGYSHGRAMEDSLLRPALEAAERVLPRDCRQQIDGFSASQGVICECFEGILSPPPTQHPQPFNLIFETPAKAPLELQIAAHVAAIDAVLATYRGYISYAQGL
jgi:predicted deacylase